MSVRGRNTPTAGEVATARWLSGFGADRWVAGSAAAGDDPFVDGCAAAGGRPSRAAR
jgi:hypothetical protein